MTIVLPAFSGRRPTSIAAAMRGARGNADRNALEPSDQPRRVERSLVADGDDLVDHSAVQNRRHEAGADALDLVRSRRAAGEDGRILRLDRDHAHARLAAFQNFADAGDRSARANSRYDDIDLAVCVVPDFLRGRATVNFRIGGVFELLRHDRSRRRCNDFVRLGDRALHSLRGGRENKFRAQQSQHLPSLDRHRFRHDEHELIAASRRHERERDPGISRSRLDQDPSPGEILPCASSASIIATPMRSLTLPIGLKNSSFPRRRPMTPFSLAIRSIATTGVSPIVSVIEA